MFSKLARLAALVATTLFVGLMLGDQWSWHRHWLHRPAQSLGWLALVVASVLVVIGLMVKHSPASAPVGVILGGFAVAWGLHVLKGISWSSLGILSLIVVGFGLLVAVAYLMVFASFRRRPHARVRTTFSERIRPRTPTMDASYDPTYT